MVLNAPPGPASMELPPLQSLLRFALATPLCSALPGPLSKALGLLSSADMLLELMVDHTWREGMRRTSAR